MSAKFIVVEGLEGAGKSSVMSLITSFLQARGHQCICTREPGGTPMAEAIRECVKHPWQENVSQETELMLMYAARKQLLDNVILPALAKGLWVVGDRHDMSSQAYQGGGRQIEDSKLSMLRELCLQGFTPDLTLYLDVEPATGLERAKGRGNLDRIELSGLDFFVRTRARYLQLAEKDPSTFVINAMQSMDRVHDDVIQCLERQIP